MEDFIDSSIKYISIQATINYLSKIISNILSNINYFLHYYNYNL